MIFGQTYVYYPHDLVGMERRGTIVFMKTEKRTVDIEGITIT